jgi:hypothetical protein
MVLLKQFKIDARLGIEPLRPRFRHHGNQVPVAGVIFAQQHQMAMFGIEFMDAVKARALCHIDFAADNRLNAAGFCSLVKINRAVHYAVVGNGNSGHISLRSSIYQLFNAAGAVKQAVFTVHMEMDKHNGAHTLSI